MTELIHAKMASVMADTVPVDKTGYNSAQGFKFRSIDDTVASVRRALVKHGVAVLPEIIKVEKSSYSTAKGSTMNVADVIVSYTFIAEDGSAVITSMAGQAADSGDKAVSKALSMAQKYLYFNTFLCGTDADPDAEIVEPAVVSDPNSLSQADKTRIAALGKRVGLERDLLRDAIQDAVGRPIASTGDLIKSDLPEIEAYFAEMTVSTDTKESK
jgi:hypothetical protein